MTDQGPRIYVIGRPTIDLSQVESFLESRSLAWSRSPGASQPAELVELAGRLCYLSFTDDKNRVTYPNSRYIANLISKGHESVLEHATWSFIIDRVSRSFTHQIVRHRIGFSFSQLSQQYHEDSEANFVPPVGLSDNPELERSWRDAVVRMRSFYRELLVTLKSDRKEADAESMRRIRSAARSVLPNAIETAIAVTANARALRHFLDVRGSIEGDTEMRQVSVLLAKTLIRESPELFGDYEICSTQDGIGAVRNRLNE